MPVAFPSIRVDQSNDAHHLWCNNGTWWLHYTVHFDHRVRRIRKSLRTRSLADAITRRDEHLRLIADQGEFVPDRRPAPPVREVQNPSPTVATRVVVEAILIAS
jgi:hypothetical protein